MGVMFPEGAGTTDLEVAESEMMLFMCLRKCRMKHSCTMGDS